LDSAFVQEKLLEKLREFTEKDESKQLVVVSLQVFLSEIWLRAKEELLKIAMAIEDGRRLYKQKYIFNLQSCSVFVAAAL